MLFLKAIAQLAVTKRGAIIKFRIRTLDSKQSQTKLMTNTKKLQKVLDKLNVIADDFSEMKQES